MGCWVFLLRPINEPTTFFYKLLLRVLPMAGQYCISYHWGGKPGYQYGRRRYSFDFFAKRSEKVQKNTFGFLKLCKRTLTRTQKSRFSSNPKFKQKRHCLVFFSRLKLRRYAEYVLLQSSRNHTKTDFSKILKTGKF